MSFLTLDNISHHYFSEKTYTKSLENVSFKVNEGEFVTILGPSGCGKSTLISIVSGFIKQTEGEVLLNRKTPTQSDCIFGCMFQQDCLFPWKKIMDNVLIGSKISGQLTSKTKHEALKLLHDAGLSEVDNKYPNALSSWMRQRVSLIRALITDPIILLLDEPFSALDCQTKLRQEDFILKMLKTFNKTTLLVTHDITEAIAMSDRIIVMDSSPGKLSRTFNVPIELREEKPFLVRKHPKYQMLFDRIWKELDNNQTDSFTDKVVGP